ncbi:hypothetical protein BDV93DRAFT_459295 [Ceratobasidium sp. AG-I]|nr:hypothetical protein BDV93DRAFT_459295 [Ceratobasidium sp. AG-I]
MSKIRPQTPGCLASPEDLNNQYHLKDRTGAIRPEVRDMLRKLACEGVSTERASDIISIIASGSGVEIVGSVSARTVSRVMLEGLVQARMQVAHELNLANSFSICSDGTTIKNQQHETRSLYQTNRPPTLRMLGVHKATSHTAQQQLTGWVDALDACCNLFSRSPLGRSLPMSSKMVAPKLRGVLTNHAADQKRFYELLTLWKKRCDREVRALSKLKSISLEEQLQMLSDHLDDATSSMGDWRTLPPEQQSALMHDAWLVLAAQIGEAEFQKLSSDTQFDTDFLAWAGCCMHKELNALRGGVTEMGANWKALGLTPPIALKNKFESAKGAKSNEDKSTRGAIKLASLAGALFNNKDDKKGYQSTIDNFFEHRWGYSKRFPDTSNTRYGSYCDAAVELILHLDTYIELLETLRDAKHNPSFTNIETNVYQGLQDTSTLTELSVLALYAQSVGRPYMRYVRSSGCNALDLGPFHDWVKLHCQRIIENPDLLLAPDASGATGALDGQAWERPEVVYRVLCLSPKLPNLRSMLVSFFRGALTTWERFTSEFDVGGTIDQATSEQRYSAWVAPTNDVSEGALGQCRQMLRFAPTMTDEQRNARVIWKRNRTHDWAKRTLTDRDQAFIRSEARALDSSQANQKLRTELSVANRVRQGKATARKSAKETRLANIQLIEGVTYEDLAVMKVCDLDDQIDKLREAGDKIVRAKSMIGNKRAKIREILDGLERRKRGTEVAGSGEIFTSSSASADMPTDEIPDDESALHQEKDRRQFATFCAVYTI